MTIFCGIDWAERHHDVAIVDSAGAVLTKRRVDATPAGLTELLSLLAEHGHDPADVPVAIETDKDLFVVALCAAGVTIYPINPRAVARYRERHAQSGGKSDPGDAIVLAHILRTDRHLHRRLPANSEGALAVKALARQHQEAVWARQQAVNRLRSLLREFYPNALAAFPVLNHKAALQVLGAAPTPTAGAKLTHGRLVTLFRRCGRGTQPALAEKIQTMLRRPALRQPDRVEAALGHAVVGLVNAIVAMEAAISQLETSMGEEFGRHRDAALLRSAPGLGAILAARVLAEIGDDRDRFSSAESLRAFAGTAPVTKASGRMRTVKARYIRNRRLADACHWWAFAAITKSAGARAHYDRRRAAGDSHNAALRNLANKLLGRLWWCLRTNTAWDDTAAWPASEPIAA